MTTEAKKLTFEAYLALPETKQRYDIVDGVLIMAPAPTPDHQWLAQKIFLPLLQFIEELSLGVVLMAPVDLLIQRTPLRTRQPDLLFLNAERTGIRGRDQLRGLQFLEVPPDLVVEVLSPSNTRREIEDKLDDYRRIGVTECWLVSPEAETIEVIALSTRESESTEIFGINGSLQSQVLGDFTLSLRAIFT